MDTNTLSTIVDMILREDSGKISSLQQQLAHVTGHRDRLYAEKQLAEATGKK